MIFKNIYTPVILIGTLGMCLIIGSVSHAQTYGSYQVEVYATGISCPFTSGRISSGTVSFGGRSATIGSITSTPKRIFNEIFTSKPSGQVSISAVIFCGFTSPTPSCGGTITTTKAVSFSGDMACKRQSFSGTCSRSGEAPSFLSFEVVWTPVFKIETPYPTEDNCTDQSITVKATSAYTGYKWEYRDEDMGSYSSFNTDPGTGASISFDISDIYGSSYQNKLGLGINFRASLGSCANEGAHITPNVVKFFPVAPYVPTNGYTKMDPKCYNGTGSLTINQIQRTIAPGESLIVGVFNSGDPITAIPVKQNTNVTSFPISFSGINPGNYYIFVQSKTSPCGDPSNPVKRAFSITNPLDLTASSLVTSDYNGTEISCVGSTDGEVTITAGGGTGTKTYSKDGTTFQANNVFQNLSAGSYTFTVKDSNNCTETTTITIDAPSALSVTNAYVSSDYGGEDISCYGGTNGKITVESSGGTGTKQYKVGGGTYQTSSVITGLSAGTYTIWVKDQNGCESQFASTVDVAEPDIITATITPNHPQCNGGTGTLVVSAEGGAGTYTYSIDGGVYQNSDVFSKPAGSYTISVKDQNGCVQSFNKSLTDPPAILVTASSTEVNCGGGNDGTITVSNVTNGTGPYTYSIDGSFYQSDNTFTGLISQNYSLIAQDANGCQGVVNVFVGTRPALSATIMESASVTCKSATDGAIDMTPSGGTSPYTYSWSNGATTEDLSNIGAGTYSIEITDANGCIFSDSYTITEPFELQATSFTSDFNGEGVSCNGAIDGSIDVDVTGGTAPYTYSWSSGEIIEDLSGIGAGTYSVEITDANNCSTSINNIEITEPATLSLTVSDQLNVDCNGNSTGSITLFSTGGAGTYEYSIDGSTTWQTTNTFPNLPAGDYTIDLRDANGCSSSTTATITEPTVLTGSVFNVVKSTCGENNGSADASASGGTAGYSYTWRNNLSEVVSTSSALTNVGGGIYIVTITDANGCTTTDQANISSADGAQITFTDIVSTSCFNSNDGQARMNITGSAPFDVEWQNGETGEQATALNPGDNVVTVTDVNGCVVVEVVNIPSPTAIDYTITSSTIPSCHNSSDGSIAIQASGGSGGYTYSWSTGNTGTSLNNIPSGTYSLIITDANGCALDTEVVLNGLDPVSLNINNTTLPTCVGDTDGSITVSATGGNGGYTYSWSTGATGAVIDQLAAGSYEVTVADSKGCTMTQSIDLPDPTPFIIDIGDEVEICTGSSYVIASDVDNAIYSWTSDNGFTSTDQQVTLSEQGTYNLHVTNADGCEAEDSFTLIVSDDLLNADFLMATEAYVGDTVVIIDISWPIPENLTWQFPAEATVLMENQDYAEVVFNTPGTYAIDMEVALADCQDFYSQAITILEGKSDAGGRQGEVEELIKKFTAYPNPNDGEFKAEVELSRVEDIQLTLVDLDGNIVVFDRKYSQRDAYEVVVDLPRLRSGIYLLGLQTGGKSKTLRLMVK